MRKDLNGNFIKENIQMTNKHIKTFKSHVIRELQMYSMRYHYIPIKMTQIQNNDTMKHWRRCGTARTIIHC